MQQTYVAVQRDLLEANHLSPDLLAQSLSIIGANHVDYADIYCQRTAYESWHLEEGIVKSGSFQIDQGVGVRAVSGDKTAFAYADSLCIDSINRSAKAVRVIGAAGGEASVKVPTPAYGKPVHMAIDPIASLDSAAKVALLNKVETLAKAADPRIVQVMAGLTCEYDMVYIARLDGKHAADIRPMVRMNVTVIAKQGERREQGSAGGGGRYDLAYFDENLVHRFVDSAVKQALTNLESRPAPAGEMTVVLGNGWPGVLLHEAVGHGLEGDFNRKESSLFTGKIGEQVTSPLCTIVDDGTIENVRGSMTVDDEGMPSQRNVLIENGILKGYLQDKLNSRLMGVAPTGNGRRESYAHLPMPRMTNTYLTEGHDEFEAMIESVDYGIYAPHFSGGQVDITSGKFVFSTAEAYLIEKGKITKPVTGATLIGSGIDAMQQVSMVGKKMQLDPGIGTCGKEGQSVPVGVGQPTVKLDKITVGGRG